MFCYNISEHFSYCFQLGPRMCLQLVKIEEGLCSGEVLFHEFGEIKIYISFVENQESVLDIIVLYSIT